MKMRNALGERAVRLRVGRRTHKEEMGMDDDDDFERPEGRIARGETGRDGPSFAALQTSECSAPLSRTLRCPRRHSLKQQELSNGGRDAFRSNVKRVEGEGGGGIESHTAARSAEIGARCAVETGCDCSRTS